MAKRKTQYTINFTADPQMVNAIVCDWLNQNGFQYVEKDGCKYYRSGSGMVGAIRCFEYYFQGNQLIILAYLKGPKNPFPLDNGMVGVVQTAPYVAIIEALTNAVCNAGMVQNSQYNGQPQYNTQMQYNQEAQYSSQPQYNQPQAYQQMNTNTYNNVQTYDKNGNINNTSFAAQNDERAGKCATLAMWMGIGNLFVSLTGKVFGVFILVVMFYLTFIGMKSSKRKTAIAALVLSIIGAILLLLAMFGVIGGM